MMGSHVCSSPNHTTGRETPLKTRAAVAMSGAFGYELDLTKFNESEKKEVREQVAFFKQVRALVQFGDFYRLRSPYETDDGSWMYVNREKTEAFVIFVKIVNEPNPPVSVIKLSGLDPDAEYKVAEGFSNATDMRNAMGEVFSGDVLMNAGLAVPKLWGQLQSIVWRLKSL
jgi:alpha-galactosidase